MTAIDEIAPDLFRLSIYVPEYDMQFNQFLVRDEEPLLFHAGLKGMFPAFREAVARLIEVAKLRHIAWSHFESDECGALNLRLHEASQAQPVCTLVATQRPIPGGIYRVFLADCWLGVAGELI